jgi:hypothetical protein
MRFLGLLFLIVAVGGLLWLDNRDGVLFNALRNASSTPEALLEENDDSKQTSGKVSADTSSPSLTSEEIEKKVNEIYKDLDEKEEDLRLLELTTPASPYAGMVVLKVGSAKATEPDKENVLIVANKDNAKAIEITGWRLESYVTNSEAAIPGGVTLLTSHTSRTEDPIFLKPGEQAYLTTGDTPLRTSFRENICTGYLAEYGDFYPSLKKSCPLPPDELLQFSSVKVSDDKCAEYVNKINRCEIADDNHVDDADLSSTCESFIRNILDYEGCVSKHDEDATFYTTGDWRIYLDKDRELWRSTREIIRLMDADGKIVNVVEY